MSTRRILFVTSEIHPLIKTGGLGDVAGTLPITLSDLHQDVRVLLPAYRDAVKAVGKLTAIASLHLPGAREGVRLLEGVLPGSRVKIWLLDYLPYYDRPGNPYLDASGAPWPDNAERFALLARAAVELARGRAGLEWRPDILHCNDWQSALAPALLSLDAEQPPVVFTIHNLSYQGLFPPETLASIGLPEHFWDPERLEFYGQLSCMKGGLVYADVISTVSPTYAREIQTPEYGCGLDGLLRHRSDRLFGILNGVDYTVWDPKHDPYLVKQYGVRTLSAKADNKAALQQEFGLPQAPKTALVGLVGRLVQQKGIDLVLDALPRLLDLPLQLVVLGSGEAAYEQALREWAQNHPGRIGLRIGYDEGLAHRIEAGSDCFLMPSRFEPCGLNQMYSLRYGTVPIVRRVGGLADSVIDATAETLKAKTATGISFETAEPAALVQAVQRALELYAQGPQWRQVMLTGMRQDFSWTSSARQYLDLYDRAAQLHGTL